MFIKRCSRSIFLQVVIGLVIGVIYGVGIPDLAMQMRPLGDGFIKLIKMLIVLIVFCVVVNGISGASDLKRVGRIGLKSVIYFEILTTIALVFDLVAAYSLGLGSGANIHLSELPTGNIALYTGHTQEIHGPVAFLMGLVLASVFSVFTENDILQVPLFPVLFGSALNLVGKQASGVARPVNEFSHIVFCIMDMVVRLAPLDVFDTMAFTTARYGVDSLNYLGALVLVFHATCLVFVMTVLGSVLRLSGVRMLPFLCYFHEKLMIVTGTASSDTVLPQAMYKLEYMGIRSSTTGLVIPIGCSFNLDGFSIYLTLAVVFITHVTGISLAIADLVTILLVSLVTSKDTHGIPGSALVILAAILTAVPAIPVAGLVLVLSVGWFMGIGRVLASPIDNCVAAVTIARWESDIDMPRAQTVLDGRLKVPAKADGESLRHSTVAGEGKLHGWHTEARCMSGW